MKFTTCKKDFMSLDTSNVDNLLTLPSELQLNIEFVSGNGQVIIEIRADRFQVTMRMRWGNIISF
jgi:hypothetical protein